MARFTFTLESLLRYRRHRRDLVVNLLAQILADDHKLAAQQAETEEDRQRQIGELKALSESGALDVDRSASRRYYAGLLSGQLQGIARSRATVAGQLDLCRKALVRADQDVKLLDRLKDKQRTEYDQDQERRTARDVEEAWLAAHWTEFAP
jgi:flagellar protein FliJ